MQTKNSGDRGIGKTAIIVTAALVAVTLVVSALLLYRWANGGESPSAGDPERNAEEKYAGVPVIDQPSPPAEGPIITLETQDDVTVETVEPDLNRLLTDGEKKELGYPVDWVVRLRAARLRGSDRLVTTYTVEQKPSDADEDGLSDAAEKTKGTNPGKSDTDGDGLSDGDEVNDWKTDPLKTDTDGDGVSDDDETTQKRDPIDPSN